MINNLLRIFAVSFFIFSCEGKDIEKEEATYKILSAVYNTLTTRIPPPPPPLRSLTTNDALQDYISVHKELESKKKVEEKELIIAVDPFLHTIDTISINPNELHPELNVLIEKLNGLTQRKYINIKRINAKRNDSIIKFGDHLLEKNIKDYLKFNKRVTFSRIAFNEDQTAAAVIGSASTSSLAGHSSLFFLEKRNGHWTIIKIIGLWIS